MFNNKRKIALALGGGSARGLANIGVLKVLEKNKVPIDIIVGSSMGALIGTGFSLGVGVEKMEELARKIRLEDVSDPTMPIRALMKGRKLAGQIENLTNKKTFSDCKIPVAITATDIDSGNELLFTSGDLQKIIRASCSWPGFFPPVKIGGKWLVDGGIKNSVPTKWAKSLGATFIIAVKVGFEPQKIRANNMFHAMIQSVQIMGEELDRYQSLQADVIIEPDLKDISQLAFDKGSEIVLRGELAAERETNKIISLLKKKRQWKP